MPTPNPPNLASLTPLRRLAYHSTVTCAAEAAVYGDCIVAHYKDMKQGLCKEEFEKFGKCVRKAVRLRRIYVHFIGSSKTRFVRWVGIGSFSFHSSKEAGRFQSLCTMHWSIWEIIICRI